MRIGLVGAGRIGAFHAETIAGLKPVKQVVVADVATDAAARLADERGYEHAADVEALLGSGVDGLVIASSTASHATMLRKGLGAGACRRSARSRSRSRWRRTWSWRGWPTAPRGRLTWASSVASTPGTGVPAR